MKTSNIIALSSFLALVSATPLAKRALVVETVTEEFTMTVDTTTTVWVKPGKATAAPQQAYQQPAQHGSMHQHLHHAAPSTAAVSAVTPQVPAPAPAPAPVAPAPVPQAPKAAQVAAPSKAAVPAVAPQAPAPAPVAPAPVAPAPKPAQPAPQPSTPPQSSGESGPSGGSCGSVGGQCSGDITYYQAGLGACGWNNDGSTEDVFALAHGMMGDQSNGNPFCGRMATIKVPGKAPVNAKLVDKCMGCDGQSIDLSTHLFNQLCDETTGRLHDVQWWFTS